MSSDENLKAVILAGGRGTRLGEETTLRPKPMVEIGGMPILWHIMKIYSAHGITDFVICLGYKGYVIKEYFANYILHTSDVTFDLKNNKTYELVALYSPLRYRGQVRCDLHPRWDRDGKFVCVDTTSNGKREMLIIDLKELNKGNNENESCI